MLKEEPSPVAAFRGYRVRTLRQHRANLAERTLHRRVIHFVPWKAVCGVFLPSHEYPADKAALESAWQAAGAPEAHLPGADETVLFGRVLRVVPLPFVGYEDLEETDTELRLACRKAADPARIAERVERHRRARLQTFAEERFRAFAPHLGKQPGAIVVFPRLRTRTLGQCTRGGEIRLNPCLAEYPPAIIDETLAHELAHLTSFNHAPQFWRTLTALLPDWLPASLIHAL